MPYVPILCTRLSISATMDIRFALHVKQEYTTGARLVHKNSGDIRFLASEKVAESLELPCKYYNLGCSEIFPFYSKLKHEAICNYRTYNCPYAVSECSVVGDIPFLVAHLRDDHKVDMHTGCTFNHSYVKSIPAWHGSCLHAFLRSMGDEMEGAKDRKLIFEGTPRSIRDSHRKVRDSHDSLIIQHNMALFFSGGDLKELKLRVTQNPDSGMCIPNLCS